MSNIEQTTQIKPRFSPSHLQEYCGPYVTTDRIWVLLAVMLVFPSIILLAAVIATKLRNPLLPILFPQQRLGEGEVLFTIYKIRTYHPKTKKITLIGRLVRMSHADELLQLWNIWRGDMDILGYRPVIPNDWEQWENVRFPKKIKDQFRTGKPGLVGPGQIIGREQQRSRSVACDRLLKRQRRKNNKLWLEFLYLVSGVIRALTLKGSPA